MRINKICGLLALVVCLGGGAAAALAASHSQAESSPAKLAATDPKAAEAQRMIDEAEQARKKAASVDSEWTGVGKLIKQAQVAMKEGDYDQAIKNAKEAAAQGMLGYEQGASQKELEVPSYFR